MPDLDLAAARRPAFVDAGHIPTIGEMGYDTPTWGVHCWLCSRIAEDYVWPCREGVTYDVPAELVDAGVVERLRDDVSRLSIAVQARDVGLRDVAAHSEWLTVELARVRAEYRVLDDAHHHRVVALGITPPAAVNDVNSALPLADVTAPPEHKHWTSHHSFRWCSRTHCEATP